MTKAELVREIHRILENYDYCLDSIEKEALNMAIEALEQIESGHYLKGDCDKCSKEYGTLGCCTTVSNHWVYSCKEGMAQYAEALEQERPEIIRCKNCRHDNNCEIQYSAQAGSEFFCGSAERREE